MPCLMAAGVVAILVLISDAIVMNACSTFVALFADAEPDKRGKTAVELQLAPLKHLYRCMEKMCFKVGENRYQAETVCDMVRCIVECDDCALMRAVLLNQYDGLCGLRQPCL